MSTFTKKPFVIIITGPTASGKTDFSYELAQQLSGEIINADSGQFYTPLNIGTAKPAWRKHIIPAHLFDILNEPVDLTVHEYRIYVRNTIEQIYKRGNLPIIVGGSLFYLKSLLFPTKQLPHIDSSIKEFVSSLPQTHLKKYLNIIDPHRASKIHNNDIYRLQRALAIWLSTGQKPSLYEPSFNPPFNFLLIVLAPDKAIIDTRIYTRIKQMIHHGWLTEAKRCINTPWENFVIKKGFIGYQELIAWHKAPKKQPLDNVIAKIKQKTAAYAKRQTTFIRGLLRTLEKEQKNTAIGHLYKVISNANPQNIAEIIGLVEKQKQNILVGKM